LKEKKLRDLSHFCYMLKPTREIWKFLKEHLVTRKPEKNKFLTIVKKKNWLNFARENTRDTKERISSRALFALKIKK
jgi:hypothetical protein